MKLRILRSKRSVWLAFWGLLLLFLVCLTSRLLWLAAETETGLEYLSLEWRDAAMGWLIGDHEPIYYREPLEQAEYWLREVDRVLATQPNDAQLTMGAAMVLDSPGGAFMARHMKPSGLAATPGSLALPPDLDVEAVKQAEDSFEDRCQRRCLELAAAAAHLEPTNVTWWQLHALLLCRHSSSSADGTPRDPNWLSILDECARHDPDNALYDYLAAHFYWHAAAKMEFAGTQDQLVVRNQDDFQKGVARFEQGLAKRQFVVGNAGNAAVADFLLHTQTPLAEHLYIINGRDIDVQRFLLLRDVWQWQGCRASREASAGNRTAALMLSRQNLRLLDQHEPTTATFWDIVPANCRVATAGQMQNFADAAQDKLPPSERQQISANHEAAALHLEIVKRAIADSAGNNSALTATTVTRRIVTGLLLGNVASTFLLLLLLGVVTAILSPRSASGAVPVVGPGGQACAMAIALATTAVLFGLAPAEIVSHAVQSWFFTASLLVIPVAFVCWIGWYWLRKRAFQFSIRAMLIFTVVVAFFSSLLAIIGPEAFFSTLPFLLFVPARGYQGIAGAFFGNAITASSGLWPWALFQWTAYYGACLTVVAWAGLVAVAYRWKMKRMPRDESSPPLAPWILFRGAFRSLSQPAFLMAAMILLVYLILEPDILQQADREFRGNMAIARHRETSWTEREQAVEKIRADEKVMSELRAAAKAKATKGAPPNSTE